MTESHDSPEKNTQTLHDPIPMPEGAPDGPVYTGGSEQQKEFEVSFDEARADAQPLPGAAFDLASEPWHGPETPSAPETPGAAAQDEDFGLSSEQIPETSVADTPAPIDSPGPAEKTFGFLASLGFLIPLIVLTLQTRLGLQPLFGLDGRSLWFSDEVRHGAAYEALKQSGNWLILTLNGLPYPDKPPLYFWFLRILDMIPQIDPEQLFLFAAALSALLLTIATSLLARSLGYDKRQSLAASLVLLTSFSFLGISQYARMDLLFAACITLSHLCLYRGWVKTSAPLWLMSGFLFATLACLIKGPLGLAFPLISSMLFLIWRGTFRRAGGRDGAFGFGLMIVILLAWVSLVLIQEGGKDYISSMFGRHMIDRALDAWHHKQPWWFYLTNLPLAWLPWTFILPFLSWERLPRLLKGLVSSRTQAPGHGWAWISLLSGVVVLSALSGKVGIYTLPLYPFLAILTAQGLLSMGPRRSRMFFLLLSVVLFVLTILFGLAGAWPHVHGYLPAFMLPEAWLDTSSPVFSSVMAYIVTLRGLPIMAAICLVFALLLTKGTRRACPGGSLLVVTLFFVALAQPLGIITAPSLNTLMSPAPQAGIMRAHQDKGYHVTAFSVTAGTYTYYMGGPMDEVNDWDALAARLAEHPQILVATRLNRWKEWQEKPELHPESFTVINTQWIAERQYVLLTRDAAPQTSVSALPQKEAESQPEQETPLAESNESDGTPEQTAPDQTDPEQASPEQTMQEQASSAAEAQPVAESEAAPVPEAAPDAEAAPAQEEQPAREPEQNPAAGNGTPAVTNF